MAKLAASRSAAYLSSPDPAHRVFLLYGPDPSQVAMQRAALVTALLGAPDDPFRLVRLGSDQIRRDQALLSDELNAISFGGGDRVVTVDGAADALAAPLKALFDAQPPPAALLVLTAGTLAASSKLRKWVEGFAGAIALPFYPPEGDALTDAFEQALHRHNLRLDTGARSAAAQAVAGLSHGEVERLAEVVALYSHGATGVSADVILACAPADGETDFDTVVQAVASGRARALPALIERAVTQGLSLAGLVRVLSGYFQRLHRAQALMEHDGLDPGAAMAKLRPPVFFKQRDAFSAQLRNWPRAAVEAALTQLGGLEADLRGGGTVPERALIERVLMRVAMSAPGARSAR